MNPKLKFLIVTLMLVTTNLLVNGQTKYEFANISFNMYEKILSVTIDDKEFSETKIEIPKDERSGFNTKPVFAKVKELQDKGWELISFSNVVFNIQTYVTIAYMRKKKE